MEDQIQCRICLEWKQCSRNVRRDVANGLRDIFMIDVRLDVLNTFRICMACEEEITRFYKFYMKVKENQQLYEINSKSAIREDTLSSVFVKIETNSEEENSNTNFDPNTINDESTMDDNEPVTNIDVSPLRSTKKRGKYVKKKHKSQGDPIPEGVVLKDHKYPRGIKVCPICGKVRDRRNFTRHLKTHERIRKKRPSITTPFICDMCGFQTLRKPLLKSHMDIRHLRIRKSICEACGAAFARSRDMQVHYKRHHQERQRQQCNECGKYFIDVYAHWAHNHRKQGTFACNICGREFDNNRRLSGHISKSHRKIECTICGQPYKNNISLKEHMNQKHIQGEPLYSCNWCEFRGNYRKNLVAHLKKLHPKEYVTIRMKHETRHDQPEIPKRD